MATVRTVTVKQDGTGDYTSPANALAGEGKDLVALDRQLDVVVGAGIYTDPISDAGFVQDATRFLRIIAAAGAEATAVWRDSGVASIQPGAVATTAVTLGQYSRIERMQVANDGSTASSNGLSLTGAVADRVFARLRNNGGSTFKLAGGALLTNCIVWGGFYGIDCSSGAGNVVYNCSVYGATNGLRGIGTTPLARNVAAYGSGTDWSGNNNNWSASSSNIAGTTSTFPRSPYVQLLASPWVSPATGDFTLVAGCPLIDIGADLSSVGVTTDIAGTARPQGAAYDIGASEYSAGAPAETHSGAASISGGGTLSAAGAKTAGGAAGVTGGGELAASGAKSAAGAASISGGGSVTATGTTAEAHSGAASVSGGGAIQAAGAKAGAGAATIAGGGALAGAGAKGARGAASISGGGLLLVAAQKLARGTVYVTGGGTLAAAGINTANAPVPPVRVVLSIIEPRATLSLRDA